MAVTLVYFLTKVALAIWFGGAVFFERAWPSICHNIVFIKYFWGDRIFMMSIFAARAFGLRDIVLIGNLTTMPSVRRVFEDLQNNFGVRFVIPENSQFGTVIGAALYRGK